MHNFDQKSLSLCWGGGGGGTIEKVTKGNKRRETVNRYFERTSFDEIGGEETKPKIQLRQNFTRKNFTSWLLNAAASGIQSIVQALKHWRKNFRSDLDI